MVGDAPCAKSGLALRRAAAEKAARLRRERARMGETMVVVEVVVQDACPIPCVCFRFNRLSPKRPGLHARRFMRRRVSLPTRNFQDLVSHLKMLGSATWRPKIQVVLDWSEEHDSRRLDRVLHHPSRVACHATLSPRTRLRASTKTLLIHDFH